jgi:hypothetical protein
LEERLCCRTCVFEKVCTSASVFHLPCRRAPSRGRRSMPKRSRSESRN